jgi:glutamate N-acetyltransferase / amino-acid N-acetyltransferase
MDRWQKIEGHLATAVGFSAAATAAGFKKSPGALDLALIVSNVPGTSAAGMFTTNLAAAAPVALCREHLARTRGRARAIIVNSGNANACTGRAGRRAAQQTAAAVAKKLGVPAHEVLVCSTGVIGVPLQTALIFRQLPALDERLSAENAVQVVHAIMTTDTRPKSCVLRSAHRGKEVHLAGVAKGAGMIHPRMATMLAFLTTDAAIAPAALSKMLRAAVGESFNRITVDGDTSTNDTVLILASGASGVAIETGTAAGRWFQSGLTELCQTLAKMIVQDGEGASKLATIEVRGARSARDADRIARAIANSPLVKTAIAGSDPNWGRILCAAGYSGAKFDPARVDIRVNDFYLCRRGLDAMFDEAAAKQELDKKELTLRVDLHQGQGAARIWTCDFTRDYIDINASYRT